MADPSFDHLVAKLFADTPPAADATVFAERVKARLDRAWALRRGLIGVAGVAGGAITVAQFADANLLGRATAASASVDLQARDAAADLSGRLQPVLTALHALPVSGEVMWMVAGLMAVAVALVAARMADRW
jgi:hypothetical protein